MPSAGPSFSSMKTITPSWIIARQTAFLQRQPGMAHAFLLIGEESLLVRWLHDGMQELVQSMGLGAAGGCQWLGAVQTGGSGHLGHHVRRIAERLSRNGWGSLVFVDGGGNAGHR